MQRESRDANVRKIEYMIRHEKAIADAVEEVKLSPRGHTGGTPTGHSYIPDPTASQALRRAAEIPVVMVDGRKVFFPERWLAVINAVREWCGKDSIKAEIFRRRYSGESYLSTCYALHIAQATYSVMMFEIRNFAIQCACQAQLVQVF